MAAILAGFQTDPSKDQKMAPMSFGTLRDKEVLETTVRTEL